MIHPSRKPKAHQNKQELNKRQAKKKTDVETVKRRTSTKELHHVDFVYAFSLFFVAIEKLHRTTFPKLAPH